MSEPSEAEISVDVTKGRQLREAVVLNSTNGSVKDFEEALSKFNFWLRVHSYELMDAADDVERYREALEQIVVEELYTTDVAHIRVKDIALQALEGQSE